MDKHLEIIIDGKEYSAFAVEDDVRDKPDSTTQTIYGLRIKGDCDLKVLEKYGFVSGDNIFCIDKSEAHVPCYKCNLSSCDMTVEIYSREIHYNNYVDADLSYHDNDTLILLYRLIKDGLVEAIV